MNALSIQAKWQRGHFGLDVNLDMPAQGVTVILGPSGSGKSTLLRILAGLEKPQQGVIHKDGKTWLDTAADIFIPPQQRRVGVVFQDYALFEHMTVAANVGFGLSPAERRTRVLPWLENLKLKEYAQQYPRQLSGGQRQRVALARAMITGPELLLLDEPFSALDTYLRQHLRQQLLELVAQFKQPVLMVTHDLNEARYLADYIGVMINGSLQRFGKTHDIFNDPCSLDVARVLGWRNFLPVTCIEDYKISSSWGSVQFNERPSIDTDWLAIRPEHIHLNTPQATIEARVLRITELDGFREINCQLSDGSKLYLQRAWHEPLPAAGSQVKLELPVQHIKCLQEGALPQFGHQADYQTTERVASSSWYSKIFAERRKEVA